MVCWIWSVMFGIGVRPTWGSPILMMSQKMSGQQPIWRKRAFEYCGAARSTGTVPGAAAPIAAGTLPGTGTSTGVFVVAWPRLLAVEFCLLFSAFCFSG